MLRISPNAIEQNKGPFMFPRIGIGTATVPHGGVGGGMLAIEGADQSLADGPHIQITTSADDHPVMQWLFWEHNGIWVCFDSYWDGSNWTSSSDWANIMFEVSGQQFAIHSDFDIPAGDPITWDERFSIEPGELVINEDGLDSDFRVEGSGETHALFVDAYNKWIIFGHSSTAIDADKVWIWPDSSNHQVNLYSDGIAGARLWSVNSVSSWSPRLLFVKSDGSYGSESAVDAEDELGRVSWQAHDGVNADSKFAEIVAIANENYNATDHGTRIEFKGTPDGSITMATWMSLIDERVGIGIMSGLAGKLHIDQSVNDAAIPVLVLDQADISEGFINFIGSDRGVIAGATASVESVRVELGGVVRRLALYADA